VSLPNQSSDRPRVSAFLIVHNEEQRLADCLASVTRIADEIIVLDDGSVDRTVEIARAAGARVEFREFDGFGAQKQAALEMTRGEWVLSIDADERLTSPLVDEIRRVTASNDTSGPAGYWVRRELIYLGTRLRFGGTGSEWVLRVARRDRTRVTPDDVHESLVVDGKTARLQGSMTHIKYNSLSEHMQTIDRYTSVIANRRALRGQEFRAWNVFRIFWELFARLIVKLGILDGKAGVIYAAMASHYAFLKSAKLYKAEEKRP
jgi:glycosyltransferase involved in cell wall biosynthesis